MSDNDRLSPADLAGAYALDAVSPEEAAEFEAYLEGSEEARIEAAELSDTAVALGMATIPVQPSAGLKADLMARLSSTPQLPPLTGAATREATSAGPTASLPQGAVAPVAAPTAADEAPADGDAHSDHATTRGGAVTSDGVGPAEQRARARWFQRPAFIIASAAAAVGLFFGGVVVNQALTNNQFEEQQATALAEINAAPDAQRASTVTSDGHPATLVWSGKLGRSALLIDDLPPLPADKDYQLWYMNKGGAFSAGTFDSTGRGTVWRVLEGKMHAGDQVGVTVEPRGGSEEPTSDPIVAIQS